MSFRILLIVAALSFAVADTSAWAQQTNKIPVVGIGEHVADNPLLEALRQGLRELGYVEGRTIRFELWDSHGHGDRLPGLVGELVRRKVDVIVVTNTPAALAVKQATSTIPVVISLAA